MQIYRTGNLFIAIKKVNDKVISGQGSTRALAIEDLNNRLKKEDNEC